MDGLVDGYATWLTSRPPPPPPIRPRRPNSFQSSKAMNNLMVVEQLLCAGVIEAIRISPAGYPNRMLHGEFVGVYRMLAPSYDASGPSEQEKYPREIMMTTV